MRYLTSRLFVHNLFICCKISDKDFHTDLNQITYDIISDKINCAIKMLNEAGCIEDTTSLLAKSFFTKLEEMKLYLATGNKSKDYYLLTIYNEAWNTYKRIESMTSKECKFPISDLNLLLEFKECLYKLFYEYGVESASYKTLQEILKASVTNYKKHQVPFVNFLLANIFPRIKSQYTPGFFATLESYPLEKLIFTDCSLTCNDASLPHNVAGLNVIRDLFDELFEISISDHELIGNKLVEIYKNLLNYRLEDNDDMEANKDIADTKRVSNLDDSDMMEYNDDSTLSIHIISFMRWIPVMVEDEDGIERMEFVDHVLSHIGDEVRKKLKERYTVQDFIKCETSLFIWEQNTDLRTLLMHAMSREPYFYKCFREYYKDSFQCNVGGIINE